MNSPTIWMALVTDENEVVFSKACQTRPDAETAIVDYLRKNRDFKGKAFTQACCWISETDQRLDLMVFAMQADDFHDIKPHTGLLLDPPVLETNLYRVIYQIDVGAGNVNEAAMNAYDMMRDCDSLPPVLDVIDNQGSRVRIDLSDRYKTKGS